MNPANLKGALWAFSAARRTRRRLEGRGIDAALEVAPPPPLPWEAERGVRAMLHLLGARCLVRAVVLQAWDAAHDRHRDLVVGVRLAEGLQAHAWLEAASDDGEQEGRAFVEILRRPAPSVGSPKR